MYLVTVVRVVFRVRLRTPAEGGQADLNQRNALDVVSKFTSARKETVCLAAHDSSMSKINQRPTVIIGEYCSRADI